MDNIDRKEMAARNEGLSYGKYEDKLHKNHIGLPAKKLYINLYIEFTQYTDEKNIYYVQPKVKGKSACIMIEPLTLGGVWKIYKQAGCQKTFPSTYVAQLMLNKIAAENKWKVWWG